MLTRPGATLPKTSDPILPAKTAAAGADVLLLTARKTAAMNSSFATRQGLGTASLPIPTAIAYQTALLERPMIEPIDGSDRLKTYMLRDMLESRGKRVANALASNTLPGGERGAAILKSIHSWQVDSFAQLKTASTLYSDETIASDDVFLQRPGTVPTGGLRSNLVSPMRVSARPQTASTTSLDEPVNKRWVTARQRELAEERREAETELLMNAWRAQRKKVTETIEHSIQLKRRPRSANLTAKVDYRRTIKDSLQRPVTANGGNVGGASITIRPRYDTGLGMPSWAFGKNASNVNPTISVTLPEPNSSSMQVHLPGRTLTLDFPAASFDGNTDLSSARQVDNLEDDQSGVMIPQAASGSNGSRPPSRPASSSSDAMESVDTQHTVSLTKRLGTPLIVSSLPVVPGSSPISRPTTARVRQGVPSYIPPSRPSTSNGRVNASAKRADRPSSTVWWNNAGRQEAIDKISAETAAALEAKAAANGADETPSKTISAPIGPAGFPLLPESSVPTSLNVIRFIPSLTAFAEKEREYDVENLAVALSNATLKDTENEEARTNELEKQRLKARKALLSASSAPAASAAQTARFVSASSGFFSLGDNPLARERLLAAQKQVLSDAAKKAAAKGGKKK